LINYYFVVFLFYVHSDIDSILFDYDRLQSKVFIQLSARASFTASVTQSMPIEKTQLCDYYSGIGKNK